MQKRAGGRPAPGLRQLALPLPKQEEVTITSKLVARLAANERGRDPSRVSGFLLTNATSSMVNGRRSAHLCSRIEPRIRAPIYNQPRAADFKSPKTRLPIWLGKIFERSKN